MKDGILRKGELRAYFSTDGAFCPWPWEHRAVDTCGMTEVTGSVKCRFLCSCRAGLFNVTVCYQNVRALSHFVFEYVANVG